MNKYLLFLFLGMFLISFTFALPQDANNSINFNYPQPSGNITYQNNTYINQTGLINDSYYLKSNPFGFYNETTLPATDLSNYYNKSTSDNRFCFANGTNSQGLECGESLPYNNITYISPLNGSAYINELPVFNATIDTSYDEIGMSFNGVDNHADLIRDVSEYNQGLNNWSVVFYSGADEIVGSVQYFYYFSDIQSLADATEKHNIKSTWLEDIKDWILDIARTLFYEKDSNINATGYNITADYFIGNGSQLTGIAGGSTNWTNVSANYLALDQTTPQTIINGTPKFTKSLIAAKTITDVSLVTNSFTGGEQAAIFQANGNDDYGVIFSAVGDHQYPLYNSFLKSRTSNGITRKAVKTGDKLGLIEFVGDTGTYYVGGAEVRAEVIATPGTTTMPTDLVFSTNFNSSMFQERWRLTSIGDWVPKADNQKVYFGAAKDASITYNGTNLVINPKEVGTGYLDLKGVIRTTDEDYNLFGDTTGMNPTILPLTGRDRLYSAISSGATSGNIRAGFFAGNFNGTSSSALNVNGVNAFANTLSSSTGDLTTTNQGGGLRSRYAIRHDGKGTVALASTITANIQANGGNITKGSLYNAETPSVAVGKTIGDLAGFRVAGGTVAGTITTRYGLKVDSLLGGTTRWGVYVDADDSFFGGKVVFTQTDGNEYIDSLADGYMDYGATTAHRFSGAIHAVHKTADGTAAVADGTYNFDGTAAGTVSSFTIKDGIITSITTR